MDIISHEIDYSSAEEVERIRYTEGYRASSTAARQREENDGIREKSYHDTKSLERLEK